LLARREVSRWGSSSKFGFFTFVIHNLFAMKKSRVNKRRCIFVRLTGRDHERDSLDRMNFSISFFFFFLLLYSSSRTRWIASQSLSAVLEAAHKHLPVCSLSLSIFISFERDLCLDWQSARFAPPSCQSRFHNGEIPDHFDLSSANLVAWERAFDIAITSTHGNTSWMAPSAISTAVEYRPCRYRRLLDNSVLYSLKRVKFLFRKLLLLYAICLSSMQLIWV